jgi:uncharacterized protein
MNLPTGALRTTISTATSTIPVWLLPDKAVFLPEFSALLVADVHIGKAATFRSLGVPVPGGTTDENLRRLSLLLNQTQASSLYILGDLFHGTNANLTPILDAVKAWRESHSAARIVLIDGNHDDQAKVCCSNIGIEEFRAPLALGSGAGLPSQLLLRHEPLPAVTGLPATFSFVGHWHPVQRISSRSDALRLPCFWLQANQLILPAFGEFTGGHPIDFQQTNSVFVTDGLAVHDVTRIASTKTGRRSYL